MDQLPLTQMIRGGVSGKDLGLWCLLGTCIRIRISEPLFDPCGILISEPCYCQPLTHEANCDMTLSRSEMCWECISLSHFITFPAHPYTIQVI